MAQRHDEDGRACCCNQTDASCPGLAVRRLSEARVRELAEAIWAASTGTPAPPRQARDPRRSQAGASARAAYRRHRQDERARWWRGRWWRAGTVVGVAAAGGLAAGLSIGGWLGWPVALLAGALTAWRLRFRPSATARVWRRQAALQRRTGGLLASLEREGYLVLHDLALPGGPTSVGHLLVGPTGIWLVESGRVGLRRGAARWRPAVALEAPLRGLRWEAAAVAEILAGGNPIPVRSLLCVHGCLRALRRRLAQGMRVTTPGRLVQVIRLASPARPGMAELASARALQVLRPAA